MGQWLGQWLRILVWLLVAACAKSASPTVSSRPLVDLDARRAGDLREQRAIELDNGLSVLLVSDPDLQKSSAALAVDVGSLEDPEDRLGMAHFLEHMLFLGTERYPSEGEYGAYVRSNGGRTNAYTSSDHTNYVFEVNHDAFEGAIDRFAQFFVAPLFTADFVDREINAVNSEHSKNLQNDGRRVGMIARALHRDGHPRQKFSTGSLETLTGITRDELIAFYERHYSADRMNLVLMGTASLDELEGWARDRFAAIEDRDVARPTYPSDIFPDDLPQRIDVVPVGDRRELWMQFSVPPITEHWASKPGRLLASLVGHEGEGSLLSALKDEGLATGLSASVGNESWRAIFDVTVQLTEAGLADVERVGELVFGYIALLRERGLSEAYFREQQVIGDLDYHFREHHAGMGGAWALTRGMRDHPALEIDRRTYTYSKYDPALFAEYVALLRPDNLRVFRIAKGLETDLVERWYGTDYAVGGWPDETVARWSAAQPTEAMHLPPTNPYLPSDISLLGDDPRPAPYRLVDDERGVLWFEQDRRFKLPRAEVALTLLTPRTASSPRARVTAELYARSVRESLNEWAYLVYQAGLLADVGVDDRGVQLYVSGYAQRIPDLIADTAERLDDITIDEETFAAIQDDLAREYANTDLALAVRQAMYERSILLDPARVHRDDYRDLVGEITLEEVRSFADTVYDRLTLEGAAYGNLDPSALSASIEALWTTLGAEPLPASDRPPEPATAKLPAGVTSYVRENRTDNHAWMRWFEFGPREPRTEAVLRLAMAHLESPFFSELRTRQQLGYIVGIRSSLDRTGVGAYAYLQSGEYPASTLAERARAFLAEAVPALAELDDETFEALRRSVLDTLAQEEQDMGERLDTLEYEGVRLGGAFDWDERVAAEVRTVTRAEVSQAFAARLDDETGSSLAIFLDAAGAAPSRPPGALGDREAFRRGLSTY